MVEISVIIPAYNAIDYLDEAIESIINQSFEDLEIICVDDGSTDTTLERLEYYASKDSRIQVYINTIKICIVISNWDLRSFSDKRLGSRKL